MESKFSACAQDTAVQLQDTAKQMKQWNYTTHMHTKNKKLEKLGIASSSSQASPGTTTGKSIVNLPNHTLQPDEIEVLSRGLNFCPTTKMVPIGLVADAEEFFQDVNGQPKETTKKLKQLTDRSLVERPKKESRDFYCLPKIHKANTFRHPIVSGNGTLCENLPGYVKGILKPNVQGTPSFYRTTTDFLQKLSTHGQVEPETFLVMMGILALYTSIPHNNGITATASVLNTNSCKFPDVILQLIRFILDH
eukprot:g46939.t1